MNTDILGKPIVLSLNRAWQVIGHRTVKQALIALNGGSAGLPPALGVDIAYPKLEDGSWNFDRPLYLNPLPWELYHQLAFEQHSKCLVADLEPRRAKHLCRRHPRGRLKRTGHRFKQLFWRHYSRFGTISVT